jgi:hypothetical protein
LTITLGYQDINFIDADIGPLLLVALPLAIWTMGKSKNTETAQRTSFAAIGFFALLSAAFWIYGYITTRDLWQTRLLLPALVPLVIPAAAGILSLRGLDTNRLRLFFIVSILAAGTIYVNLLDMTLTLIARNPLATATGLVTSQAYLEKYQPGYASAVQMVSEVPLDSTVYSLLEPRSYGMTRSVQPDPILDNFSHDVYLSGKPEDILARWQRQGHTHVLLQRRAVEAILGGTADETLLEETIDLLELIATSPDGSYELFEVPLQPPTE